MKNFRIQYVTLLSTILTALERNRIFKENVNFRLANELQVPIKYFFLK